MSAAAPVPTYSPHAPNAALLIDFDNVTMGIRSDLGNELRNLLSSDIIKGKVAVQRAYADWRRYPQYIVPLAESSIDMIMAPAYGSSKKNATDIRLSVDAMELVFTRPEIGTYILLSGDSDFASLVTKLKEYGKYVIGVGIRESSSDLLVMNCDEYYSYNALAGLVKAGEEEVVKKDPWELVTEAIHRMKRNGDVMRSDRLKQVMQELDANFDEKSLGISKFSRFTQEAAERGLLKVTKLENGQLEVDVPELDGARPAARPAQRAAAETAEPRAREERGGRGRGRDGERGRGRRGGRGRDREREPREVRTEAAAVDVTAEMPAAAAAPQAAGAPDEVARDGIGTSGELLTRDEAFNLVRQAVDILTGGADAPVLASDVRRKARDLLGRDSLSLSERMFVRILRDAHDSNVVDLRKRGDDWELAPAAEAAPITEQLQAAAPPPPESQAGRSAAAAASFRRGIGMRGRTSGARELPPELLSIGVVDFGGPAVPDESIAREPGAAGALRAGGAPPESIVPEAAREPAAAATESGELSPPAESKTRRGGRGRKTARKSGRTTTAAASETGDAANGARPARTKRARSPRGRTRKPAASGGEE
jgi:uncharacterized protein (TIGR00288 family)